MKLGLYADPHISQNSSIITSRDGSGMSGRLSNIISTFEWMNNLFSSHDVDKIVCLGDMTDKPNLTAEEITAMSKCNCSSHYFIVGNHCRSDKDGSINSLATFDHVISEPCYLEDSNNEVFILPYSRDVFDLSSLNDKPKLILSHNDFYGYDYGGAVSKSGYTISEVSENCELFINGHLHNGGWIVENKIMNLGAVTGLNFASCSGQWNPSVAIVDTETLKVDLYENPEAFKFRKFVCGKVSDVKKIIDSLDGFHYVLQFKVPDTISEKVRKLVDQYNKIDASRIIVESTRSNFIENKVKFEETSSIYDKLKEFISLQGKKIKFDIESINSIIDSMKLEEASVTK